MAPAKLTAYECQRLENIRRKEEMLAGLKLQSIVTQLSASSKRERIGGKANKVKPQKKPKSDTPVALRRSLRTRGMQADSKILDGDLVESTVRSPNSRETKMGPLTMREALLHEGSDRSLIETILNTGIKSEPGQSLGTEFGGRRVCKEETVSSTGIKSEPGQSLETEFGGRRVCKEENVSSTVIKSEPGHSLGTEFGGRRVCKEETVSSNGIKSEPGQSLGTESGGDRVCKKETFSSTGIKSEPSQSLGTEFGGDRIWVDMTLNPENVARVVQNRIMSVKFFPCSSSSIVVAGSKGGDVGFWNLDHANGIDEEDDGVYSYHTHSGPVSGISIHQHSLSKVFTSCYDGYIRLMDAEKEVFDLVYSSDDNKAIFSLSQRSNDAKCVYFGEGYGNLSMWDERTGGCATQWSLHGDRINSIDFNLQNPNFVATSCSDGTACIWDLRSINTDKPKTLKTVTHKRAVYSAYFSPSGKCLATTSLDDTVRILDGDNFEEASWIPHNNQTGRWISQFKAIWGWDDSYIFIGNMKRGVDVISPSKGTTIVTLQSEHITAIPCRFDAHPYKIGMLAGATGGGQLTAYELQRLENIRRKEEMMAGLKLHSMVTQLSASSKRERIGDKVKPQKKPKGETPVAERRSLRTREKLAHSKSHNLFRSRLRSRNSQSTEPSKPLAPMMNMGPLNMREALLHEGSDRALIETILSSEIKSEPGESLGTEFGGGRVCNEETFLSTGIKSESAQSFGTESGGDKIWVDMTLNPENVARIVRTRIMSLKFFPCSSSSIVVAGSRGGDVGFWNLDHADGFDEEDDGVYTYHPHSGSVSGISIHQHSLSKVFTSCYDGHIRLMDAEKEMFDLVYSADENEAIFSLSQRSDNAKCVYFGAGLGNLSMWDERSGCCAAQWSLHDDRVNSIDFNLQNPNFMATSCADGTACIWDLRKIDADKPKTLNTVTHKRAVCSAYFSPSGNCLATTSLDDTVRILSGANFEESSWIPHSNQSGTWIPQFRAIWGWDDSYIFIGNMNKGVDVISPSEGKTIVTLQSEHMKAIPCRFDAHPYNVGMLAGAIVGGQVYVWTRQ
ncbi:hypothetical protein G4B88_012862 [Cannabis sativa]|uniref:WD repeat-containing protein 76 n=1 Tax=Cannabis sativa TaxID=3483 RepID=A0A7J6DN88_CANSA|nr:hypothetical protein G4B88_012862 [Cannabis sativa]